MAIKFSQFPSASSISLGDSVVGLKDGENSRFSFATVFSYIQSLFVPTSRKINNKALNADITLDASDVGAVDTADVGEADGVASLDSNGKVPGTQLDLSGKQDEITASGILKGDGQGGVSAAVAGTDYQAPLTIDANPTENSTNPVQSAGVYDTLEDKANQAQLAYVETSTTASRAYALGDYFCLKGYLRKATSAISQGATITDNNSTQIAGGGMSVLAESRLFKQIGSWSSGSKTITIPRGYGARFYLFGSPASAYNALLIAASDGGGTVQYTVITQGAGISFSTGTGTLTATLQSGGNAVSILEMPFMYDHYSTVS